ncbi:hypothetical protein GF407_11350 [candidate division KSB1 bacterium]|nr:hypothetical protein [candidate division KSB1 bacterium]
MYTRLKNLKTRLGRLFRNLDKMEKMMMEWCIDRLKSDPRYGDKKHLIPYGYKLYSQHDEDGIIREIFNRIGTSNKVFIEIGVGNGLENNTLALLFDHWQGLWIEASKKSVDKIQKGFKNTIACGTLKMVNAFVSRENINALISQNLDATEIDLLSIDIDGNDFHLFDAIDCIQPRVVVIEYNAKFPPPISYCMTYDQHHVWSRDDHFGASLKFLETRFAEKGYCLVGCNITGSNAFFVRKDLTGDKFLQPFSAEMFYEPARYYLLPSSHDTKPAYKTLEKAL